MSQYTKIIAVTGGAGFIGSNLLLYLVPRYENYLFVNIDCLTYAGNPANLKLVAQRPNYCFEKIDINDFEALKECFEKYAFDGVIHLAAESHVDRSIEGPAPFIYTNILGTFNLLELARRKTHGFRFHHVSTDEVFGTLGETGQFTEISRYQPSSPYAASKAAGDHLVRAYYKTYGLDIVLTNCSNNFGPFQNPEKLIPLTISRALAGRSIPVYGNGGNIRNWIYVADHCRALDLVFHRGKRGETYNIGSESEFANIDLVKKICGRLDLSGRCRNSHKLIEFVDDRPGHDYRYSLDSGKINKELDWKPEVSFDAALDKTIQWYLDNEEWLKTV